jgi:hypothetical protein
MYYNSNLFFLCIYIWQLECYASLQNKLLSTEIQTINSVRLPRNFSFVYPRYLIGSSMFKYPEQIQLLSDIGVGLVINLMEEVEEPIVRKLYELASPPIKLEIVRVENTTPPSIEQMKHICSLFEMNVRLGKVSI